MRRVDWNYLLLRHDQHQHPPPLPQIYPVGDPPLVAQVEAEELQVALMSTQVKVWVQDQSGQFGQECPAPWPVSAPVTECAHSEHHPSRISDFFQWPWRRLAWKILFFFHFVMLTYIKNALLCYANCQLDSFGSLSASGIC